jgi:hypothetical protein
MKKIVVFMLISALLTGTWLAFDLFKNEKIKRTLAKDDYAKSLTLTTDDIMIALEEGITPDYSKINDTMAMLDGRYDTSDFLLPSIIRILYSHSESLPNAVRYKIEETIKNYKFWMDQPGADSMCYWSENHQILFSSGEYLLGNFYKDTQFTNMNIMGGEHRELGKQRVLTWLEQRYLYGFSEWYSSTYYPENLGALSVLIDFAPDEEVRIKASMILDLMIYDLATQNFKGTFTANSGRMYESAKMSGTHGSMREPIALIWPEFRKHLNLTGIKRVAANFKYLKNYTVPPVLRAIGYDQKETTIIKASNGLNISELESKGLIGLSDPQVMMQFASEAFTNKQVINNTLAYVSKNNLLTNEFLHDLKSLNVGLIKLLNLAPIISESTDFIYNGTALQRANTYMYRTPSYAMSTAQSYHPGTYGDQHSLFSLNVNSQFNIFNQHPAQPLSANGALGISPNYWVGNGYQPHTVQHKNVNLTLWNLPEKENTIGKLAGVTRPIAHVTHTFFPKQFMDQVDLEDNYAFAKIADVYIALIGKNELKFKALELNPYDIKKGFTDEYDLIQLGRETFWITEVATTDQYSSFSEFKNNIKATPLTYEKTTLTYGDLTLSFAESFKINGENQDLEYKRFDSKYSQTERTSQEIIFEFSGEQLLLNFNKQIRDF